MSKWTKIPYEVGKKTVGAVRKMNVKGAVNTASNVALGAGIVSMLPLSASPSTDKDIERINGKEGVRSQNEEDRRNGRA